MPIYTLQDIMIIDVEFIYKGRIMQTITHDLWWDVGSATGTNILIIYIRYILSTKDIISTFQKNSILGLTIRGDFEDKRIRL